MAGKDRLNTKRSFTGHPLLPAIRPTIPLNAIQQPAYGLLAWTLGRGSVIWRIWPAVLLHTVFAAIVVYLREEGGLEQIAVPGVLLTVLGVIIGFVISYRALSGYDRYWMGRTYWSDVMRNSRTIGRLIWFHVPPRLTPKTAKETELGQVLRPASELNKVMAEKRMALDLVEGFAVALKHHIRGEIGIYYEDLYDLVRPLHDHEHTAAQKAAAISTVPSPSRAHRIASNPSLPKPDEGGVEGFARKAANFFSDREPVAPPPKTAYGTFEGGLNTNGNTTASSSLRHAARRTPSQSSLTSSHQPLQPAQRTEDQTVMDQVSHDLIPFAGMFASIRNWFRGKRGYQLIGEDGKNPFAQGASSRKWQAPVHPRVGGNKHRRVTDNRGENLPLEILRCLSEWFSVLEDRNTVPGTSLGGAIGTISAMEETLTGLERILTTPLPFGYSVHIRTVWIYLFFLPFQLVDQFAWYTIPGVSIASFIYLGFLAAGEEIEQPFGYDENDLDLDMFCQEVVHVDIENLKKSPCLNAYLPGQPEELSRQRSMTLIEASLHESETDD